MPKYYLEPFDEKIAINQDRSHTIYDLPVLTKSHFILASLISQWSSWIPVTSLVGHGLVTPIHPNTFAPFPRLLDTRPSEHRRGRGLRHGAACTGPFLQFHRIWWIKNSSYTNYEPWNHQKNIRLNWTPPSPHHFPIFDHFRDVHGVSKCFNSGNFRVCQNEQFGGFHHTEKVIKRSPQMVSDPHKDQPFEPVENAGFTSQDLQWFQHFMGGLPMIQWSNDPYRIFPFGTMIHIIIFPHEMMKMWIIHVVSQLEPEIQMDPVGTSVTSVTGQAHFCISITKSLRPGNGQPGLWTSAHCSNRDPEEVHCFIREIVPYLPIFTYNIISLLSNYNCNFFPLKIVKRFVKLSWHDHHFIIQTPMILVYLHRSTHPNSRRKPMVAPFLAMTCFA